MTEARMQEAPEYKPGTFCWVELGTTDNAAAKTFYTQLFGWEYEDHPMGPGMVYTMLKLNGKDVGALYELMPDMRAQGVPPHWLSYVSVSNADETAEKAKAEGATLLKEPFDVMTEGRMAVVQDPTGAVFALWQAKNHKGSAVRMVPNSVCWNELGTNDPQEAGEFYSHLFGCHGRFSGQPSRIHALQKRRRGRRRHVQDHAGNGTDSATLARLLCRRRLRRQGPKSD
jgi:uncharacterized protein